MSIYAEILAAGQGIRMGNTEIPKQFLPLGNKPVIIHTIERFLSNDQIDRIIIVTSKSRIDYTKDLIKKYIENFNKIEMTEGGLDRQGSLLNGIKFIESEFGIKSDDIVLTHDAVRPFTTCRIISENIEFAKQYGAVNTVIPATDTIVESHDGKIITKIPLRKDMYQSQTPQSFNIRLLLEAYSGLSENERVNLTDAANICVLKGKTVRLVKGEIYNIKITTPYDLLFANAFLPQYFF